MEDYDEYDPTDAYFASLQGPSVYGTHQASQRLRGPARREQTFTFAATPPGSRNRQTNQRNSRPTYWIDDQPVLHDLTYASVTAKVPKIPPITETAAIKHTCLQEFITKMRNATGTWNDKTEATASEFSNIIPNLESQARGLIDDMQQMDSNVYNYQAGELLNSMYERIVVAVELRKCN